MDKVTRRAQELYDAHRFEGAVSVDQREELYSLLLEFVDRVGADHTLYDVGCGKGAWLDTYLRRGVRRENIVCADLAPQNVEALKRQGFEARCTNVLDLDLDDDCADFTICQGVIHHTPDPLRAFSELVRITKPGGALFVNVYNCWNPYFYLVHRAAFPLRYAYWNMSKRVVEPFYQLSKLILQPLSYAVSGKPMDEQRARTLFMDQVITPRAHLFSKARLRRYARRCGAEVETLRYQQYYLMVAGVFVVTSRPADHTG